MPYYGDHMAGDPGLFGFVKKLKLGRVIGGLIHTVPGASGVLSAVNAIRDAARSPGGSAQPTTSQVIVPTTTGPAVVRVSATRAARARRTGARFGRSGRAISPFARRMAAARRARLARAGRL